MFIRSADSGASRLHWFGEPVVKIRGDLDTACERMPTFTRMPFGTNESRDVIVREQSDLFTEALPVAVVSRKYELVQHHQVLRAALHTFAECGVASDGIRSDVFVTEAGTRMCARMLLTGHAFNPGDGHEIDLTFECYNSVDRTVPLFAALGWFRLVCSNGLIVGTAARFRQRHVPPLNLRDFVAVLRDGFAAASADRDALSSWCWRRIARRALVPWVEGPLTERWGALAAGRVHHIASTGFDGVPLERFERVRPHERTFGEPLVRVPGAPQRAETFFDIVQALSWVASTRTNFQDRLVWRSHIPALVQDLVAAA